MKIAIVVYKTQVMEEPLHAKLRPVERATRRTFKERENPMNDNATNAMSKAIATQQETRTPAPVSHKSRDVVSRLDSHQRTMLYEYLRSQDIAHWMIGKTLVHVANRFNDDVAQHSDRFKGKRVTDANVRSLIVELGYGTLSHAIVAVKAAVLAPLDAPPVATGRPFLAEGVEAVTMYKGQNGVLYDSAEAANASYQAEIIAGVVYRVGRQLDEHFEHKVAFEIATALVSTYNISAK